MKVIKGNWKKKEGGNKKKNDKPQRGDSATNTKIGERP